jgi:hypothetical protein
MRRAAIFLLVLGCTENKGPTRTGPQSIKISVAGAPGSLGTRQNPLTSRNVMFDVQVIGPDGKVIDVDRDLSLYTWFLGTLGRSFGTDQSQRCANAAAMVHVTHGTASGVQVTLPPVFGPTQIWLEDCTQPGASFAVGATDPFWFPYPTIADVSQPRVDPSCDPIVTLFANSALEGKQVAIDASPTGKIVVTGKFAQFYTVTDTGLPTFHSLEIYSFGAPPVNVGDVIVGQTLTGAISEFNGMTELNFPLATTSGTAPLPPPTVLTIADFNVGTDMTKALKLEGLEAAVVELDDGCVCPAGTDYATFQQWSVAFKTAQGMYNCGRTYALGVTTAGQVAGWDPPKTGKHISAIRGVLVNIAGCASRTSGNPFSFFILHPRDSSDIVDAGDTCTTM